jgi:hypothetical protein
MSERLISLVTQSGVVATLGSSLITTERTLFNPLNLLQLVHQNGLRLRPVFHQKNKM